MKKHDDNLDKYIPFYANISKHKTSAEIISEARAVIHKDMSENNISMLSGGSGAPRPLGTQRPFTPRERQRTLFGKASRTSRPPSAVNLKYLKHQCTDSIKKKGQLSPVLPINCSFDDHIFNSYTLDNIDEKLELSIRNKTNNDEFHRRKPSHVDHEQVSDNAVSKLKLPSLNGLAKPLHQRKIIGNKICNPVSGSFETQDDAKIIGFSTLIPSKSLDLLVQKPTEDAELLPNISMEVFNKKRIFSNTSFKNEDHKLTEIETVSKKISDMSQNLPGLNNSVQSITDISDYSAASTKPSDSVQNILNHLSSNEPKTDVDVSEMLFILYDTLDKENLWQTMKNDDKTTILKVLFSFIESTNEKLLIAIARIILALRVTGSNLSGVCKLIFKIARNDKNDYLFLSDNVLELFMVGLGRAEPLHDAECLVYGYGALKFLGMNSILLERMRPLGALALMTLHLKMFNEAISDSTQGVGEQGCHGLYQLTGALRNLAGGDLINTSGLLDNLSNNSTPCNHLLDFINGGTLTEICRTINYFTDDLDVVINASRTLSVLSADYECCVHLCKQKGIIPAIIKLLTLYTERTPLVVRLTYILGNMVACNNDTRLELYDESGSIGVLLKILDSYIKHCWHGEKVDSAENIIIGSDLDGSNGSDEDVMIKTIRVIANMCMNPMVGAYLSESTGSGDKILSWILKCLHQYSSNETEELIVSTLSALNNLSYYHSGDSTKTALDGLQIHFCEALCQLLLQKNGAYVTEAIRVLGNMSRSKSTRDYIVENGVLMDITRLTENEDEETALAAAGVLVNMAADENARKAWIEGDGLKMALSALQKAANNHHWQLAQLICQAFWNATPLPHTEISNITPLLLDILDEQQVFGGYDDSIGEINLLNGKTPIEDNYLMSRLTWEEFAAMAVNLLEKIDPTIDSPPDEYNLEDIFGIKGHKNNNLIPL